MMYFPKRANYLLWGKNALATFAALSNSIKKTLQNRPTIFQVMKEHTNKDTNTHTYIHTYISFLLRCIDLRDNSRFSHEEQNLKRRCFSATTQNILFSKRLLDTLYSSPNSLNLVSTTLNTQGLVV